MAQDGTSLTMCSSALVSRMVLHFTVYSIKNLHVISICYFLGGNLRLVAYSLIKWLIFSRTRMCDFYLTIKVAVDISRVVTFYR